MAPFVLIIANLLAAAPNDAPNDKTVALEAVGSTTLFFAERAAGVALSAHRSPPAGKAAFPGP